MPIDVETIAATSRFTPATCYTDQRSSPCVLLDEWYEPIDVMRRYMHLTAVAGLVFRWCLKAMKIYWVARNDFL